MKHLLLLVFTGCIKISKQFLLIKNHPKTRPLTSSTWTIFIFWGMLYDGRRASYLSFHTPPGLFRFPRKQKQQREENYKMNGQNVENSNILSAQLINVPNQFVSIPQKAVRNEKIHFLPDSYNKTEDHIQGFTQYEHNNNVYFIFSHSGMTAKGGHILIATNASEKSLKKVYEITTPDGWNHPGGIQAIGDYLFVPCENSGKSIVLVYNLLNIIIGESTVPVQTVSFNHNAGCLGITSFGVGKSAKYLLLLGDSSRYHAYTFSNINKIDEDLSYSGDFVLDNIGGKKMDCQGFGLVTDAADNKIYMVALMSHLKANPATYADWGYLIELLSPQKNIYYEYSNQCTHFSNVGGHIGGTYAVHFRWGAGIRVNNSGKLTLLATERNIIDGKLDTNFWVAQ